MGTVHAVAAAVATSFAADTRSSPAAGAKAATVPLASSANAHHLTATACSLQYQESSNSSAVWGTYRSAAVPSVNLPQGLLHRGAAAAVAAATTTGHPPDPSSEDSSHTRSAAANPSCLAHSHRHPYPCFHWRSAFAVAAVSTSAVAAG